jgi:putative ABC transport system permease protein
MHAQLLVWTLRRRPWRNALIMSSVALTVAVMIAFFSTQLELSKFVSRLDSIPYQRFWVKPRNLTAHIEYPLSLKDQIAKVPGVVKVMYVSGMGAMTPDGVRLLVGGGSEGILEVERDFFPVDDATIARWNADPTAAVFGDIAAEALHLHVGSLTELETAFGPLKLRVAGISRGGPLQTRVVMHYKYVDEVTGSKGIVGDYRVVLDKKTDSRPVVAAVDQILEQHGLSSHLVGERTMMQLRGFSSAGLIPGLLGVLGLVLLVTTAMAITNTTIISVRERRAELATLRVLGFKKRSVAVMIVSEVFAVCIVGAAVGIAIAWFAMRDGIALGSTLLQSVHMSMPGLVAGAGSCLVVAIAGSAISSWLAVRAPLGEALRDAG